MLWLYGVVGLVFLIISACVGISSTLFSYFVILHDPVHVQLQFPLILDYDPFVRISAWSSLAPSPWTYRNVPAAISAHQHEPGADEDAVVFTGKPRPHSAVSWTHIGNNNTLPLAPAATAEGRRSFWAGRKDTEIEKVIRRSNQTVVRLHFDYDRFSANRKWFDSCPPADLCKDTHPVNLITVHATVFSADGKPYAASNVAHHSAPATGLQRSFCQRYRNLLHVVTAPLPIEGFVDGVINLGWCRKRVREQLLLFPRLLLQQGSEYFRIRITSNSADPAGHYSIHNPTLVLDVSTGGLRGLLRRHCVLVSILAGLFVFLSSFSIGIGLIATYAICASRNAPSTAARQHHRRL